MAALPAHNTSRVWVDYNDGINDHSMMVRWTAASSDSSTALGVLADFFAELDTLLYATTITGARVALVGSDVTNPVVWPGDAGYGTGVMPGANAPRQVMWEGKDNSGHRWKLSLFGMNVTTPNKFRFVQGDDTHLDAARAILGTALSNGTLVSINVKNVLLKLFMSVNFNNHFEAGQRG